MGLGFFPIPNPWDFALYKLRVNCTVQDDSLVMLCCVERLLFPPEKKQNKNCNKTEVDLKLPLYWATICEINWDGMVELCKYTAEDDETVANKSRWMLIKIPEEKLKEAEKAIKLIQELLSFMNGNSERQPQQKELLPKLNS